METTILFSYPSLTFLYLKKVKKVINHSMVYIVQSGARRRRGIKYNVANSYWHDGNREMSLNNKDTMFHQFRVSGTLLFPTLHSRTDKFQYFISHINISWVWSIIRAGKVLPHVIRHFSHKIKKINKNNIVSVQKECKSKTMPILERCCDNCS